MGFLLLCGGLLIGTAFLFFFISLVLYLTRGAAAPGGAPRPAAKTSPVPPPALSRKTGDPMRDQFIKARIGQTITVNHPQRGPITGKILGSIRYTELWQRVNSPSEPWTPTGNEFVAHWLGNFLLYEWQDRLYLLDDYVSLTDQDIQTSFMPYAKRFAQSNQTAHVVFDWPPASWVIKDIGKFSVAQAEGAGLRLSPGATGRFIHGDGADNRAIVLEDYQSGGGGQDTAWTGWSITWKDITKIG